MILKVFVNSYSLSIKGLRIYPRGHNHCSALCLKDN